MSLKAAALATFLVCWSELAAGAADWTQWGGSDQRNMASDEKHLPATFVPGEKDVHGGGIDIKTTQNVKWVVRLGTQSYGTTVVANGRVYVGTNDAFLEDPRFQSTRGGLFKCLDEATGKLLWSTVIPKFETNDKLFNYDNIDLGLCSSPAVEGERLWLVTNRGEVVCMTTQGMAHGNHGPYTDEGRFSVPSNRPPAKVGPQDGDILWRYDMVHTLPVWPQDASCSSVLIHGDLVYAGTSNGVDRTHDRVPYPLAPSLIALDKNTGRVVAQDDEKIGTRLFHGQWSSPALATVNGKPLVIYGGGDGVCYAFEALDKVPEKPVLLRKVWSFDCNPPDYKLHDGKLVKYRDGDIRRKKGNTGDGSFVGPSEIIATPVVYKNRVYVATGQDPSHGRGHAILVCYDATKTGDITQTGKVWEFRGIDRTMSSVSIADGLLYIADTKGGIYCLDADTGKLFWNEELKAEIWGSTYAVDGKVYVGTKKSLWVFAQGKEKKVLGEIRLGLPVYCTCVAANGVLYVATHKYLWAVQTGSTPAVAAAPATTPSGK